MSNYITILEYNHKHFEKKLNEYANLGAKVINSSVFQSDAKTKSFYALSFYALMEMENNEQKFKGNIIYSGRAPNTECNPRKCE